MQMLTLASHDARRWEPQRLRHRLFTVPAQIARTSRQVLLHLSDRAPWAHLVHEAIANLRALARLNTTPDRPDQPSTTDRTWNRRPTRDDIGRTFTPRCHNQHPTAAAPPKP